jgi:hypothetical protein
VTDEVKDAPAFLAEASKADAKEGMTVDALEELSRLAHELQQNERDIAEKEAELLLLKEKKQRLGGVEIPQLLLQRGLSQVRLKTGEKIEVKSGVSVSIPDDRRADFFQFLTNRREDDIVKLTVAFSRMESEAIERLNKFLVENAYDFDAKEDVNPNTLKKYFKELLGLDLDEEERAEGVAVGRLLRTQDVEAFAKVFTYYTTKVK